MESIFFVSFVCSFWQLPMFLSVLPWDSIQKPLEIELISFFSSSFLFHSYLIHNYVSCHIAFSFLFFSPVKCYSIPAYSLFHFAFSFSFYSWSMPGLLSWIFLVTLVYSPFSPFVFLHLKNVGNWTLACCTWFYLFFFYFSSYTIDCKSTINQSIILTNLGLKPLVD